MDKGFVRSSNKTRKKWEFMNFESQWTNVFTGRLTRQEKSGIRIPMDKGFVRSSNKTRKK